MTRIRRSVLILAALALVISASTMTAVAGPRSCDNRNNNTFKKLLECVTVDGVREHQAAFQAIADANGGTRAAGTTGYAASAAYVADAMTAAGYDVTLQPFDIPVFYLTGPSTLDQIAPVSTVYAENVDFEVMTYSASGNVTAPVTAVDLDLGLGNASTSGCEAADFAGFPAGNIALLQRGACSFQLKAENAAAAGAVGAIIFNQGNDPSRTGLFFGTLSSFYSGNIPVVSTSYDLGEDWAGTPGLVMNLVVDAFSGTVTDYNVIAESTWGDPSRVVMVGAALDSPAGGPGINNNGSGSAAILEVALLMDKVKPHNKVRFAWWGGAFLNLIGSETYVNGLTQSELEDIVLYLGFDTIGSPNYVRFVNDGDGSEFGFPGAPGSDDIETLFENFFGDRGLAIEPTLDGWAFTDAVNFFFADVPFGGLYTGSVEIKTPAQAAVYGGTAGDLLDPCSQLPCDTFDNVSLEVLDQNADAAAYAILHYAQKEDW